MSYKLTYRPEVELDIDETAKWYEKHRTNLGFEFIDEVEKKGHVIESKPFLYEKVYKNLRRAVLDRFPFNIFYMVEGESIIIVAVMHGSRHPKRWQKRI